MSNLIHQKCKQILGYQKSNAFSKKRKTDLGWPVIMRSLKFLIWYTKMKIEFKLLVFWRYIDFHLMRKRI